MGIFSFLKRKKEPQPDQAEAPQAEATQPEAPLDTRLEKTRKSFGRGLLSFFTRGKKIDEDLLEELETQLIVSDIGVSTTEKIISSIRDRLSKEKVIGSSSITWGLLRVGGTWKINQILFNDGVYNPSIVAQVFLGRPNGERRDEAPKAGG